MTDVRKTKAELVQELAKLRTQQAAFSPPDGASEKKIEGFFRGAPMGIGIVADRVLMDVNDTLCRMIGYSADELIGPSALILNASDAIGERSVVITIAAGATLCDEDYLRKTRLHDDLAPGLYVHLEVSDTGCGMDTETLSHIFEPFFTTKFTGRGLGLAAVIGIVRSHHGALKVYSELGKGTTFKILLPVVMSANAGPVANPAGTAKDDWHGNGTVLLVDDEETLRALGARMLGSMGFSVLLATDGCEAVDHYRERGDEIVLVLLDLTMPRMDGIQAFGELRQINPKVRVVIASGYNDKETAARVVDKGLSGVIQKPYSTQDLKRVLRQALEPGNA